MTPYRYLATEVYYIQQDIHQGGLALPLGALGGARRATSTTACSPAGIQGPHAITSGSVDYILSQAGTC